MKLVSKFLIIMTVLVYLMQSNIDFVNNFDVDEFNRMFPATPLFDLEEVVSKNAEVARKAIDRSLSE